MRHSKPATPVAHSRPEQGRGSTLAAGVALHYADPHLMPSKWSADTTLRSALHFLGLHLWEELKGAQSDAERLQRWANLDYARHLYHRGEVGYVVD